MNQPLRALIVEDSADDAKLILRELTRGSFDVTHTVVQTITDVRSALEQQLWDIVLCDYALPHLRGTSVLPLVREICPDTPLIFVSGTIGEDLAVEAMKAGAQDYVMKDKLARLAPAVRRELADADTRRAARRAEAELRASEARFRIFVEHATDAFFLINEHGVIQDVNEKTVELLGYTREELIGMSPTKFDPDVGHAGIKKIKQQLDSDEIMVFETRHRRKDGTVVPVELRVRPFWQNGRRFAVALAHNVTERKRLEAERLAHVQFLECMDRINRALHHAASIEEMMRDTLDVVLTAFQCDRACLIFPCDRRAESWTVPMERVRSGCSAALTPGQAVPMDAEMAQTLRLLLESDVPVKFGSAAGHALPVEFSGRFAAKGAMAMAIYPKTGQPWLLSLHISADARVWTPNEERLFQEIGRRLADALTGLLTLRDLQSSQEHLSSLISSVDGVVWEADAATLQFTFVSQQAQRLLGYPLAQWLREPSFWISHIHPDDRDYAVGECEQCKRELRDHQSEYRFLTADGRTLWLRDFVTVLAQDGRAVKLRGIMVDITAQKTAELRIQQLNRTYAVLSEINQLIVRERDPQNIFEGVCRVAVQIGGFPLAWVGILDSPAGTQCKVVADAGTDAPMLEELRRDCTLNGHCCTPISEVLKNGGYAVCNEDKHDPAHTHWCRKALNPRFRAMASFALSVAGRNLGVLSLYTHEPQFFNAEELALLHELAADISYALENCERERQRLHAEEQLRASQERFRELAETIDEVFWISNAAFDPVFYVSPAYEKIWGRPCQSLYENPRSWLEAVHPGDRENALQAMEESEASGKFNAEFRIIRPDGQVRWISNHGLPVRDASGKVERVVGVARDVTENHQLGEQLRQSQKLEAIGQLAGGVAHDFNNILSAILMQTDLLSMDGKLTGEDLEGVREIRADTERAANLTRQLLLFSRKQMMQARDLDLNEVVTGLAKMLQRIIGEDVRLQLILHPSPLPIHADAGMLDQVLMNLAVNARDAMPEGGKLTIETREKNVDEAFPQTNPDAVPGRYACLSVTDTGSGIPPEVVPRIFEPFFTTKETGKGTGLGLATVFGIVKQHHGWIDLETEPGRGTVFRVFLPASTVMGAADQADAGVKARGGTETILLAEDEASVRRTVRMILHRHGYKVICAANGEEAIKAWDENRDGVSLLLTDVVMPGGMNGQQLAERLHNDRQNLKVIYVSGYSARVGGKEIRFRPDEHFLQKPFHTTELLEIVRKVLDG